MLSQSYMLTQQSGMKSTSSPPKASPSNTGPKSQIQRLFRGLTKYQSFIVRNIKRRILRQPRVIAQQMTLPDKPHFSMYKFPVAQSLWELSSLRHPCLLHPIQKKNGLGNMERVSTSPFRIAQLRNYFNPTPKYTKKNQVLHESTYLERESLTILINRVFQGKGLSKTIYQVVFSCPTCFLKNPQGAIKSSLPKPAQHKGSYPEEDWPIHFIQVPPRQGHKYLLVFVDTLTSWIEAFPISTERA